MFDVNHTKLFDEEFCAVMGLFITANKHVVTLNEKTIVYGGSGSFRSFLFSFFFFFFFFFVVGRGGGGEGGGRRG